MQSPPPPCASKSTFVIPQIPEPRRRPNPHLPFNSQPPQPAASIRDNSRAGIWNDSFASSSDRTNDASMDTWFTERTTYNIAGDMAKSDYGYTCSYPSQAGSLWSNDMPHNIQINNAGWDEQRPKKEKERRLVVTLQDDQLGQIIEAISPPKRAQELPHGFGSHRHEHASRPPTTHTYYPPKVKDPSLLNRPSSAAMVRTSSYQDFNSILRNTSKKLSPEKPYQNISVKDQLSAMYHPSSSSNKENCPPSESRLPTSHSHTNRAHTPSPFSQKLSNFQSDSLSRHSSTVFSSLSEFEHSGIAPLATVVGKSISAHAPSAVDSIKSRKEGKRNDSPEHLVHRTRNNHSLLQDMSSDSGAIRKSNPKELSKSSSNMPKAATEPVEIIDVDAIDGDHDADVSKDKTKLSTFKLNHKSGMSSIDSTGRLERQLFSALGEELGSFGQQMDTPCMGPELTETLGATMVNSDLVGIVPESSNDDFEPAAKRKRQGTLGGDRDKSPVSKKKGGQAETEEGSAECVSQLRRD